ncbi:MAG: methionyl aminopeptidase [Candidatus Berkelbacteria bacterium Gr01-1014_85]|uniref:Methionine aminopeptidase n=1 Tax=Candidatus Berkelbacteria bacterium Gr01-1014_85 TaxID=2017150 RepID=A0A554JAI2_9BACT|nr:MAG: methionyl aminopeptidase [Candidatus Berkelbacteria bacterium Gr01-1014_85]
MKSALSDSLIKSAADQQLMRQAGQILQTVLDRLVDQAAEGMTTLELDQLAETLIRQAGAEPTFKGFHDYPYATCLSVNEAVVHGLPDQRRLQAGDLLGIDVGLRYQGWCVDSARTIGIGQITPEATQLLEVTAQALEAGLAATRDGLTTLELGRIISAVCLPHHFGVVRELTGHGIGREQWEEPSIPNYPEKRGNFTLRTGMTIAIEPMVTLGSPEVYQARDGWTIVTADHSLAAHFEATVIVQANRAEILVK